MFYYDIATMEQYLEGTKYAIVPGIYYSNGSGPDHAHLICACRVWEESRTNVIYVKNRISNPWKVDLTEFAWIKLKAKLI